MFVVMAKLSRFRFLNASSRNSLIFVEMTLLIIIFGVCEEDEEIAEIFFN
jgi:hypothetical protein